MGHQRSQIDHSASGEATRAKSAERTPNQATSETAIARARSRAMALAGRSDEAAATQTPERVTAVQALILVALAEDGPMTDDALADAYARRQDSDPTIPKASPASIRSRRAELGRRGLVRATNLPGVSQYGRPATVHALAATAQDASRLW